MKGNKDSILGELFFLLDANKHIPADLFSYCGDFSL